MTNSKDFLDINNLSSSRLVQKKNNDIKLKDFVYTNVSEKDFETINTTIYFYKVRNQITISSKYLTLVRLRCT